MRTDETKTDVEDISVEEIRTGLRKMKKGKAQGPDDIPVELWIALRNKCVEFLVNFFNRLLQGKKMPDEWRRSVLVPLYKGKGHIKECGNYRGNQVDESLYETVGEGNRSKDKERR